MGVPKNESQVNQIVAFVVANLARPTGQISTSEIAKKLVLPRNTVSNVVATHLRGVVINKRGLLEFKEGVDQAGLEDAAAAVLHRRANYTWAAAEPARGFVSVRRPNRRKA